MDVNVPSMYKGLKQMDFENISAKQRGEIEQQARQLLNTIRRAKLQNDSLVEALQQLELALGEARREQFDTNNTEYHTF